MVGISVLTAPVLVVRQMWPTPREVEYHVLDEHRTPLATARYLPKDEVAALLRRDGLRSWTAAVLRVSDAEGESVFTVAFPGMRARAVLLVRDGEERLLGTAVRTKGHPKARYELRCDGRVLGAIQVLDWRQRGAHVENGGGAVAGMIRTIDEGYSLIVERPLEEPLRSLVVASTIALRAAIGDESYPGSHVEDGGGTTVARAGVLPTILDPLRRKRV